MKRLQLSFFILLFALSSCTGHDIEDPDVEASIDDERPTGLPPIATSHQACIDPDEAPEDHTRPESFEDWVSGATDVVIGTVVDIRPVFVPFRVLNAVPTEVSWEEEECSDLSPAVDIYLTDVESLLGSEEEIKFRVSTVLMSEWETGVVDDGEGQYWIEHTSNPERGIAPGMRIGTRLYHSELLPEVLTPAMTLLFEVDEEDESIYFQRPESELHYACAGDVGYFNRPEDSVRDGISVDQLREGISDLQVEAVPPEDSTRPYIRNIWMADDAQHLIFTGAARCQDYDSTTNVCLDEHDCEPGTTCVDGQCN